MSRQHSASSQLKPIPKQDSLTLYINCSGRRRLTVESNRNWTILQLKQHIQDKHGFSKFDTSQLQLIFADSKLENERSIESYDLSSTALIFLASTTPRLQNNNNNQFRPSNSTSATTKDTNILKNTCVKFQNRTIQITIDLRWNFKKLKEVIKEKFKITHDIRIICTGNFPTDNESLQARAKFIREACIPFIVMRAPTATNVKSHVNSTNVKNDVNKSDTIQLTIKFIDPLKKERPYVVHIKNTQTVTELHQRVAEELQRRKVNMLGSEIKFIDQGKALPKGVTLQQYFSGSKKASLFATKQALQETLMVSIYSIYGLEPIKLALTGTVLDFKKAIASQVNWDCPNPKKVYLNIGGKQYANDVPLATITIALRSENIRAHVPKPRHQSTSSIKLLNAPGLTKPNPIRFTHGLNVNYEIPFKAKKDAAYYKRKIKVVAEEYSTLKKLPLRDIEFSHTSFHAGAEIKIKVNRKIDVKLNGSSPRVITIGKHPISVYQLKQKIKKEFHSLKNVDLEKIIITRTISTVLPRLIGGNIGNEPFIIKIQELQKAKKKQKESSSFFSGFKRKLKGTFFDTFGSTVSNPWDENSSSEEEKEKHNTSYKRRK